VVATGAWICFEDESGRALQPPKARTRGRRGRTPVVLVSGRGSGRISVAGLACIKAGQPGRFYYRMQGHRLRPGTRRAMSEADYAALITAAHGYLNAPVIVICDSLNTHLIRKMHAFTTGHPDWLTVIRLPAYALDLNPVEAAWSVVKNSLGNLVPAPQTSSPLRSATSWTASSDDPASSTDTSARPGSPSNQNRPDTQTPALQAR
jgi:DDE superfamily endonuclease